MTSFLIIVGLVYVTVAILIYIELKQRRPLPRVQPMERGSIIICGRNEEVNLPACLASVERQTISPDSLEVILVDDASTDATGQLMEDFKAQSRFPVTVLHMPPLKDGERGGKWRPLKEGIKLARHDALLLTDADAELAPTWSVRHLEELERVDVSAGIALIQGDSIWRKIQHLDWLFVLGVGSSLAHWGMPQAALGKNLSVRRTAYDAVGGLEGVGFSLTEDRALVQALVDHGSKVVFPLMPDIAVKARGEAAWRDYVQQRKRWASGIWALKPPGKLCILMMGIRNIGIIVGLFMGLMPALWVWIATALANFIVLSRIAKLMKLESSLYFYPFWELFYTWTPALLAIQMQFIRKVVWKGHKF
ncbi:glycosyltransferase [bacterium]|nr:glycosyltransferase [bacterium]MBU1651037.1 glycosyltransferase [bacterium]MBU1881565.1 glycosyltransferase [bacterium]